MLKAEELDLNYQPEIVIPDIEALTNEEWLESRMEGIGGSDAGAILGLNKYTTAYQICRSKLGFTGEAERTPEDQYTLDYGHANEKPILDYYARKTGFEVFTDRAQYRHPLYPFMLADCDGFARTPEGELIGLELKTYNFRLQSQWHSGVFGKDGIIKNPEYAAQVAHYMAVMNLNRYDLLAQCGNQADDLIVVTFRRDLNFEASLIDAEKRFWEDLQAGIYPEVKALRKESYERVVEALLEYPKEEEIRLADSFMSVLEEILDFEERKTEMNRRIKEIDEKINALRIPVIEAMDNHIYGTCGSYSLTLKGVKRESVDARKLQMVYPEIYTEMKKLTESAPSLKIRKGSHK